MAVSLDLIKKLRKETKAGVMEVRKALEEGKGDFDKAKKWLVKRGLDKAAKKADREITEGTVASYVHNTGKVAAIVKLGCETDFVAKTEDFQELAKEIAMQVASMNPESVEELSEMSYIRDSKKTIDDLVKAAIAKLGENMQIVEFSRLAI